MNNAILTSTNRRCFPRNTRTANCQSIHREWHKGFIFIGSSLNEKIDDFSPISRVWQLSHQHRGLVEVFSLWMCRFPTPTTVLLLSYLSIDCPLESTLNCYVQWPSTINITSLGEISASWSVFNAIYNSSLSYVLFSISNPGRRRAVQGAQLFFPTGIMLFPSGAGYANIFWAATARNCWFQSHRSKRR